MMNSRFLRTLVLAFSLTLALPQGWCCMFAVQTTEKAGSCPMAGSPGCCCPCANPQPGKSKDSPAKPVPVQNCPCTERNATITASSAEQVDIDLGFVAVLAVIDFARYEVGAVEEVACRVYAPPRSLHVLHCLWLC